MYNFLKKIQINNIELRNIVTLISYVIHLVNKLC